MDIVFIIFESILFVGLWVPIVMIVHEAGHLVFGLLSGYTFHSFRVFFCAIAQSNGKVGFKWLGKPFSMAKCCLSPSEDFSRFRYKAYYLGGALFNLLLGGLLALLLRMTPPDSIIQDFLDCGLKMNLYYIFSELFPFQLRGSPNDGKIVRLASESEEAKRDLYEKLCTVN